MLAALGFRETCEQQREFDVLVRRQHRDEVVHLEDEPDVPGAPLCQLAARHVGDLVARDGNGAGRGNVEAAEKVEQRGFSRAARPHEADEVALVDVEVEALENT